MKNPNTAYFQIPINRINKTAYATTFVLTALTIISAILIFARPMRVDGDSMLPSYKNNDIVFVNTTDKNIAVGDVIVFKYGEFRLIKRVAAIYGDKISVTDDTFYKNGIYIGKATDKKPVDTEYTLGENEFFVIGDNIDNSRDSRSFGCVDKNNVIGKVL
jgi:signal peptidase I